jgi:hypothetical protein
MRTVQRLGVARLRHPRPLCGEQPLARGQGAAAVGHDGGAAQACPELAEG